MNMKKLIIILSIGLIGCEPSETSREKWDRFMTELDCPIILIGKTDKAVEYPSIVVIDGSGRVRTMYSNDYFDKKALPNAISSSRAVGDTLKFCPLTNQ